MRGFATLRLRRLTLNFVPRISSFVHSNTDLVFMFLMMPTRLQFVDVAAR